MVMGTSERKQRERARREEEIVAKAKELFLTKGYDETTIDEIADSLEISKGAIYLHFGSKEELFFRILREGSEIMYERFQEAMDQEEDGLSKYGAIGLAYAKFWNDYPDYHRLFNFPIIRSVNNEPGPERKANDEINLRVIQLNIDALQKGKEDGSVRSDLDPMMTAFIISNATRGVLEGIEENRDKLSQHGVRPEEVMNATLVFFGQALGRAPGEAPHHVGEWVQQMSERSRTASRSSKKVRK
jgi:AcrR family transcriptional regulator